jgi:hypothetical protein
MRRIFFVHIPRTGGTTIEALMRQHLTEGTFHNSYWEGPLLNRKRRDLLKSDYFIGHNFYYAREILPPVYSFTFLRDPVERLFSLWMFMLEHNPELAAKFDDFMDCARRNPHFSNHQVRFLAGRYDIRKGRARVRTREIPRQRMIREVRALRSKPVNRVDLEIARDVLSELNYVGIFEDFEPAVAGLFSNWGVDLELPLPRERKSTVKKTDVIDITDADRDELEELNTYDRMLYEAALRRYETRRSDPSAQLEEPGDDEDADVGEEHDELEEG